MPSAVARMIAPAKPMTVAEHEFLIGDGSMAGAFAGARLRFVYCTAGCDIPADEWREHIRAYPGARSLDDNGPHKPWGFEREPDGISDYLVVIDGPAVWP